MSRITVTPALLLYSPVGLILVFIRSLLLIYVFLASVILYTVSPIKRIILRFMCSMLGFIVTSEGIPMCTREQPIVSNCATLFDHMAMNLLINCVTPHKFMLSWALTWRHLNYEESNCKNKITDVFHIEPEETPTGTKTNMILQFNPAPFRLFNKVQPVAISVTTYLPINLSVHPIDWKYEIFWVLFNPMIRVHVKFLPPIVRTSENDQNIDEFIESVRNELAKNLNAKLVDMDKTKFWLLSGENAPVIEVTDPLNKQPPCQNKEYEKCDKNEVIDNNQLIENCVSNKSSNPDNDPRIGQVLAVLPNARANQVKTLLDKMCDVESVIAYLLEQVDTQKVSGNESNLTMKHVAPSCHKIAASSFSRNPEERHKSFSERKAAFLENARLRYLEIHQN